MKEKKTIFDTVLNTVSKGSNYKTNMMDLDEMVYMLDSVFISNATTEEELKQLENSILAKFLRNKVFHTSDGSYRVASFEDPNSIKSRYQVSIYDDETEYRYTAFSRGKMKKAIEEKIAEQRAKISSKA